MSSTVKFVNSTSYIVLKNWNYSAMNNVGMSCCMISQQLSWSLKINVIGIFLTEQPKTCEENSAASFLKVATFFTKFSPLLWENQEFLWSEKFPDSSIAIIATHSCEIIIFSKLSCCYTEKSFGIEKN